MKDDELTGDEAMQALAAAFQSAIDASGARVSGMLIEGEILPSESETQALARNERRIVAARAPRATVELALPTGTQVVPVTEEEFNELVTGQLYIGFYNLSGYEPDRQDFEGLQDKSDDERRALGLDPRRGPGLPRGAARMLEADNSRPYRTDARVALAPIHRDARKVRWRTGVKRDEVLRCRLEWPRRAWVTHFAIGSRQTGILFSGEFNRPYAVQQGNGFKFGLKLSDLFDSSRSLPPTEPETRPELGEKNSKTPAKAC